MADFPFAAFGITSLILFGAYTLFGITGFGQSIIAMPFLVMVASLRFFVPLVALLDGVFVLWNVAKFRREVNYRELIALVPTTTIGIIAGATIFLIISEKILLLSLGVLITCHGVYCILQRGQEPQFSRIMAVPLGLLAGALSATFGTGGPLYVAYLSGRIRDKGELRATIVQLLLLTALLRIGIFGVGGFYADPKIWVWWALSLPFCFAGVKLGHYLHDRLKSESLLMLVYVILVIAGIMLIIKNI